MAAGLLAIVARSLKRWHLTAYRVAMIRFGDSSSHVAGSG